MECSPLLPPVRFSLSMPDFSTSVLNFWAISKWYFMSVLKIIRIIPFLIRWYSFLEKQPKMLFFMLESMSPFLLDSLRLLSFVSRQSLKSRAVWCLSRGESSEYRIASFDCVEISKELLFEVCPRSWQSAVKRKEKVFMSAARGRLGLSEDTRVPFVFGVRSPDVEPVDQTPQ